MLVVTYCNQLEHMKGTAWSWIKNDLKRYHFTAYYMRLIGFVSRNMYIALRSQNGLFSHLRLAFCMLNFTKNIPYILFRSGITVNVHYIFCRTIIFSIILPQIVKGLNLMFLVSVALYVCYTHVLPGKLQLLLGSIHENTYSRVASSACRDTL